MPRYFSYIGKLNSPNFFWNDIPDANFRSGNTPNRIIPKEFSLGLGFAPGVVDYWVKKGGLEGKQIDWAGWGLKVRKSDIVEIWEWKKAGERGIDDKEWLDVSNEIQTLQDDETYVLVVMETVE